MRNVPKKITVEIKHYRDHHNCKYVELYLTDSMGRARYSCSYTWDPNTNTWYYPENGKRVDVTQEHVFRNLLNTYKSLMSVEDLITDNLTIAEEGY